MVCNRWESEGLLFTSGELSQEEAQAYETHLEECSLCKDEHRAYIEMKEIFFIPEFLEERTNISIDALFNQVEREKKSVLILGLPLFSFLQQRVAPAFVLLVGIFIGYSFLPKDNTDIAVIAKKSPELPTVNQDSLDQEKQDTLREFREGGTIGIQSVSEVE